MKDQIFKAVKANDELPKESGEYFVYLNIPDGEDLKHYSVIPPDTSEDLNEQMLEDDEWENTVKYWLKPTTLSELLNVTEEEIDKIADFIDENYIYSSSECGQVLLIDPISLVEKIIELLNNKQQEGWNIA